jgi:GAF domain-containing protein
VGCGLGRAPAGTPHGKGRGQPPGPRGHGARFDRQRHRGAALPGAALGVATELARKLEAERVSIGFMDGGRIEIAAMSHTASFNQRMDLVRQVASAMDEALDQRASIVHPAADEAPLVTREHVKLAQQSGAGAIVTVPLFVRDSWFGGLTLELPAGRPR